MDLIKNLKPKGQNDKFVNLKQWQKDFIMYPKVADIHRDSEILEFVLRESGDLATYKLDGLAQRIIDGLDNSASQYVSDMKKRVWKRFKLDQEKNKVLSDFAAFIGHPIYMIGLVLVEIGYLEAQGKLKAKDKLILERAKELDIYAKLKC